MLALFKERELCVCEVVDILQMSQHSVSQHLRKMKSAGLVNERKRGQWTYYSLNIEDKPYVNDILQYIPSLKSRIDEYKAKEAATVCE